MSKKFLDIDECGIRIELVAAPAAYNLTNLADVIELETAHDTFWFTRDQAREIAKHILELAGEA